MPNFYIFYDYRKDGVFCNDEATECRIQIQEYQLLVFTDIFSRGSCPYEKAFTGSIGYSIA